MGFLNGDRSVGSAAQVLEEGLPCRIVIVESLPLGKKNGSGELYAFTLTVMTEGRPPFQTQIGMPVPAAALPLLYPGNNVPGRRLEIDDHHLMVDWDAAQAEAEQVMARPGAAA